MFRKNNLQKIQEAYAITNIQPLIAKHENGGKLLMKDLTKIPISRQNRIIVKEALNPIICYFLT